MKDIKLRIQPAHGSVVTDFYLDEAGTDAAIARAVTAQWSGPVAGGPCAGAAPICRCRHCDVEHLAAS